MWHVSHLQSDLWMKEVRVESDVHDYHNCSLVVHPCFDIGGPGHPPIRVGPSRATTISTLILRSIKKSRFALRSEQNWHVKRWGPPISCTPPSPFLSWPTNVVGISYFFICLYCATRTVPLIKMKKALTVSREGVGLVLYVRGGVPTLHPPPQPIPIPPPNTLSPTLMVAVCRLVKATRKPVGQERMVFSCVGRAVSDKGIVILRVATVSCFRPLLFLEALHFLQHLIITCRQY